MTVGVRNVFRGCCTIFNSYNAPIGNASRSSISSQRRSSDPSSSRALEETRKPMSKQATHEISHDLKAEDTSSSAAASTTSPYNVNRRYTEGSYTNHHLIQYMLWSNQLLVDQVSTSTAHVSHGNVTLQTHFSMIILHFLYDPGFDSPSGTISQPNTMGSPSHHGSFLHTTSHQQQQPLTRHTMNPTAQKHWTLPPLSSFENSQHASASLPLSPHFPQQQQHHHTPSYYYSNQQQGFNPSSIHHHSPIQQQQQQQHVLSSPLSSSSAQGGAPLVNPSLHSPSSYRAQSSSPSAGPSTSQHTGPRIEWRSERPELVLHTPILQRSRHPADQQQPTVLPSLREQLERIGMVPPSSSQHPDDAERWKSWHGAHWFVSLSTRRHFL